MVFSETLRLTGSIDMQYRRADGTIVIADWKRSKGVTKTAYGGKRGTFPMAHLPDSNFFHYALQQNLYRTFLETFYGETVSEMFLVVLHPDQKPDVDGKRYIKIPIPRMDRESHRMLETRRLELVEAGRLDADVKAYVYKTAADLGLVATDDSREVFRRVVVDEP